MSKLNPRLVAIFENIEQLTSTDELTSVYNMYKNRMNAVCRLKKYEFRVDQNVKFTGRGGKVLTGKIWKINQKTIKIRVLPEPGSTDRPVMWNVSANLVSAA